MVISWYGQACFKIQSGELVIGIDPFPKDIGLSAPRFHADILLVTHNHKDHSYVMAIGGDPFIISGPGEYEVKHTYIHGIETYHDNTKGSARGLNTVYSIKAEDLTLVHLGDFGEDELRGETLEAIGSADILMIPVGGVYTIDAAKAARITKQIEPRYVIPMHYAVPGLAYPLEGRDQFLKEMSSSHVGVQEKFSVKKKDIGVEEKIEVVVLKQV